MEPVVEVSVNEFFSCPHPKGITASNNIHIRLWIFILLFVAHLFKPLNEQVQSEYTVTDYCTAQQSLVGNIEVKYIEPAQEHDNSEENIEKGHHTANEHEYP